MKKLVLLAPVLLAALAACSPRINIDFLGEDKLQEVVLVPSEAKDKVLMIDIDGTISAALETSFFVRTAREWQSIVDRNPFREEAASDPAHLVVMFLKKAPR